jgi:hypothetical protein
MSSPHFCGHLSIDGNGHCNKCGEYFREFVVTSLTLDQLALLEALWAEQHGSAPPKLQRPYWMPNDEDLNKTFGVVNPEW